MGEIACDVAMSSRYKHGACAPGDDNVSRARKAAATARVQVTTTE